MNEIIIFDSIMHNAQPEYSAQDNESEQWLIMTSLIRAESKDEE